MLFKKILILSYIFISIQKKIKNGVYNLLTDNLYLFYSKRKLSVSDNFFHPNTFFNIKIISKTLQDTFYNIVELYKKKK